MHYTNSYVMYHNIAYQLMYINYICNVTFYFLLYFFYTLRKHSRSSGPVADVDKTNGDLGTQNFVYRVSPESQNS